jgi:toxin-antitoxin system PIN domain toxin
MSSRGSLLDVNVLVALADADHSAHRRVTAWFNARKQKEWVVCPFTEAGFVRVVTNSSYPGSFTMTEALNVLDEIKDLPGYRFCPVVHPFSELIEPFQARLYGHQQVTDAILLGVAVTENLLLVTLDKALPVLAGPRYETYVKVLG